MSRGIYDLMFNDDRHPFVYSQTQLFGEKMITTDSICKTDGYAINCSIGNTDFNVYLDASFNNPPDKVQELPVKLHSHCCNELLIALDGPIVFKTPDKEYNVPANSMVFCPSLTMHVSSFKKCLQYVAVNFDFKKNAAKKIGPENTYQFFSEVFPIRYSLPKQIKSFRILFPK